MGDPLTAESLALLKLYIEWGADEAIESTPQSRLGATATPIQVASAPAIPISVQPPAQPASAQPATQPRAPAGPPPAAKPAAPKIDLRKIGPMDQAAIESARDAARTAQSLEELQAAL